MPDNANGKVNIEALAPLLVKEPLFMFLCPQQEKREGFIKKYLSYAVPRCSKEGAFTVSDSGIVTMLYSPQKGRVKISGKNSLALKRSRYAENVLDHQSIVNDIVDIVVPEALDKKVLNVFITRDCSDEEIRSIIDACKKDAQEGGYVLVYETLSKRLVPVFENAGFQTGYARNIMNTRFFQTVMTYNI